MTEPPTARVDGDMRRAVAIGYYIRDRWAKEEHVRAQASSLKPNDIRKAVDEALDICEPAHFDGIVAKAEVALEDYVDRHRRVVKQADLVGAAQSFRESMQKGMKLPLWRVLLVWLMGALLGAPIGIMGILGSYAVLSNFTEASREETIDGVFKLFGLQIEIKRESEPAASPLADAEKTPEAQVKAK